MVSSRAIDTENTPTLSVIVPTYNHQLFVLEAIESVQRQNSSSLELIVVNDGSTDNTSTILQPLHEARLITLIEQPNLGQAAARNRGLQEAVGTYVAFLDDDDLFEEGKLAWQVQALESRPDVDVVWGRVQGVNGELLANYDLPECREDWTDREFFANNRILSPGQALFRRSVLIDVKGFDTRYRGADDWDLYLRLLRNHRFLYLPNPALRYRFHATNASKRALPIYRDILSVYRAHYDYFHNRRSIDWVFGPDWLRVETTMRLLENVRRPITKRSFLSALLPLFFLSS